jgi:hypothetical protein
MTYTLQDQTQERSGLQSGNNNRRSGQYFGDSTQLVTRCMEAYRDAKTPASASQGVLTSIKLRSSGKAAVAQPGRAAHWQCAVRGFKSRPPPT